ncbi:hypothetical protein BSG1_08451, partial [Bacillus sp. SG-1]
MMKNSKYKRKEGFYLEEKIIEKALLVGCQIEESDQRFQYSMEELASLTETAQAE